MTLRAILLLAAIATSCPAQSRPSIAAAPQADDYAGEPVVLEHSASRFLYRADGTGDRTLSQTIHLQSAAAVRQFGVLLFPYAADNDKVEIRFVRVRKPDGTLVATDPASAQDLPAEVTREAPFYSDQRQLQIPARGLAVGDRLEYEVVIHTRKSDADGQFYQALNFEDKAVAPDQTVELRFPSAVKVNVLSPNRQPSITTAAGETVYTWHGSQTRPTIDAHPGDPQPKRTPDVAWTTFPSWAAVGEWYRTLAGDRAAPTPELRAKAAALTVGAKTDDEKIARIYAFVSMQVRYVGVDFGIGRFQPHAAGEVLTNGYGDCKDKHTLLAALLAAAGFPAEPVLIGANIALDRDLPAPNNFNHVITAVPRPAGARLWLDSTAEVAPPGMLVAILRDKDALLIPAAPGAPVLVKTPAGLPFPALDRWDSRATLAADGKLTGTFDVSLRGDFELLARAGLFTSGQAQWPQVGQNLSSALGFGGTVSDFTPTHVDDSGAPLHMTYSYKRDNYADWENHRVVSLIPGALFGQVELDKQPTEPISLGAPRTELASSTITLPQGFAPESLPTAVHAHASYGDFTVKYTLHGQDLVTEVRLEITKAQLPAAQWQEYNAFGKDLNNSMVFIQLTTAAASSSSEKASGIVSPPAPVHTDTQAQALLLRAAEQAQKGQLAEARTNYEAARALNPEERGIWLMAAMLDAQSKNYPAAEADLKKAQTVQPEDNERILRMLVPIELAQKHQADAIVTLSALEALAPDDAAVARQHAALLVGDHRPEEAIEVLESVALHHPSDKQTLLALANAQASAGRKRESAITFKTVLENADDFWLLNDAAYGLADQNLDLPLARASAEKALTLLTDKSKTVSLDAPTAEDLRVQRFIPDTWDTLGWIDHLQGNDAAAEPLLKAAWLGTQTPTVGYHLGVVYEKEGKMLDALEIYELAAASPGAQTLPQSDDMKTRRAALGQKGLKPRFKASPAGMLGEERSLTLPLLVSKRAVADFLLLASPSAVDKVQFIEGDEVLRNQDKALQAALTRDRERFMPLPAGSGATLLRRVILSCSVEIHSCQFVLFLPANTQLPAPVVTPTNLQAGK